MVGVCPYLPCSVNRHTVPCDLVNHEDRAAILRRLRQTTKAWATIDVVGHLLQASGDGLPHPEPIKYRSLINCQFVERLLSVSMMHFTVK